MLDASCDFVDRQLGLPLDSSINGGALRKDEITNGITRAPHYHQCQTRLLCKQRDNLLNLTRA